MASMGTRELVVFQVPRDYPICPLIAPKCIVPKWSLMAHRSALGVVCELTIPLPFATVPLLSDTRAFIYSPQCLGLVYNPCSCLRITRCHVAEANGGWPSPGPIGCL